MRQDPNPIIEQCEAVLASHVVELATELRGCEAADLISLIWLERTPSLRDVLGSSCETLFRPETMTFGGDAEVVVTWSNPPTIHIPMEFRANGFEIYYRLTMMSGSAFVEIELMRFDGPGGLNSQAIGYLDVALAEARNR